MKQKKEKVETPKFYSLSRILAKNADYNVIFGERSNGKLMLHYCTVSKNICAQVNRWHISEDGVRI